MSEFNQSATDPASRLTPGIRATVAGLVSRAVERWHRRRAAATLDRLDDRLLEDIGISRNDIPFVAAGLVTSKLDRSLQDSRIAAHAARSRKATELKEGQKT